MYIPARSKHVNCPAKTVQISTNYQTLASHSRASMVCSRGHASAMHIATFRWQCDVSPPSSVSKMTATPRTAGCNCYDRQSLLFVHFRSHSSADVCICSEVQNVVRHTLHDWLHSSSCTVNEVTQHSLLYTLQHATSAWPLPYGKRSDVAPAGQQ